MYQAAVDGISTGVEGEQQRERHRTQPVDSHGAGHGIGGFIECRIGYFKIDSSGFRIGRSKDVFGQCRRRERPHREKRKPAEELHHPQLQHHLRHSRNRTKDFLGAGQEACRIRFRLFKCSKIFRRFFVRGPHRDDDGNQEHRRAHSERVEHRIRNLAGGSFVFRTQLRNNPRKVARHPGANTDDQRLQNETKITLVFR